MKKVLVDEQALCVAMEWSGLRASGSNRDDVIVALSTLQADMERGGENAAIIEDLKRERDEMRDTIIRMSIEADAVKDSDLLIAAKEMDWMQVVLNQGPPCFHLGDDGFFCGRAERWAGHEGGINHEYLSFARMLAIVMEKRGRSHPGDSGELSWVNPMHVVPISEVQLAERARIVGIVKEWWNSSLVRMASPHIDVLHALLRSIDAETGGDQGDTSRVAPCSMASDSLTLRTRRATRAPGRKRESRRAQSTKTS